MLDRVKRVLKHSWLRQLQARQVISQELLRALTQRIADSEALHSGEICIYVESGLPLHDLWRVTPMPRLVRQRALAIFQKMGVWDTQRKNGVLIYLLLAERRIEIVADKGLDELVPADTWTTLVSTMGQSFKTGDFEGGLNLAVQEVSGLLQRHFGLGEGHEQANPNELPNAPMLG